MRALVIVPTYNERENIAGLLDAVLNASLDVDVLIVDDGSPDGTGDIVAALQKRSPRIDLLRRAGKLGLGTAYVAGFRHALANGYDAAVQMDADWSHDPDDVPRLLAALRGADVAVGSRMAPGGRTVGRSPFRVWLSSAASTYARLVLGTKTRDCTAGFRAIARTGLLALPLDAMHGSGFAFQIEAMFSWERAGMRVAEVPVTFAERTKGKSKMSLNIIVEALILCLKLRASPPVRPPLPLESAARRRQARDAA